VTDLVHSEVKERKRLWSLNYYHNVVKKDPALFEKHRVANRESIRRRRLCESVKQIDRDRARKSRQQDVVKYLLKGARGRAVSKGLPFDLTEEWARERWTGHCEVTGFKFEPRVGGQWTRSPSLDRIQPMLGYLKGNCRFVLSAVNSLKGSGSNEEMFVIAKAICAGDARG
jgi:hypothetical protein